MISFLAGCAIGAAAMCFVWNREVLNTRQAYQLLRETAENQMFEYWEFRQKFEAYRARFDPLDLTREGNVIKLEKGKL